jgi:hypothetical protein
MSRSQVLEAVCKYQVQNCFTGQDVLCTAYAQQVPFPNLITTPPLPTPSLFPPTKQSPQPTLPTIRLLLFLLLLSLSLLLFLSRTPLRQPT